MKRRDSLAGYLGLMQLEQYELSRYLRLKISTEMLTAARQRLKMTLRARLIYQLAYLIPCSSRWAVVIAALPTYVMTQLMKKYWYYRTRGKIRRLKRNNLKVVVIAGSYGKSSVKHLARQLLVASGRRVVVTPESYNTLLGIAKVVEWEVDSRTEIFLCEVGAYRVGEIKYLLGMIEPSLPVLTGITAQHLERFGSREKIVQAKLEIAEYAKAQNLPLVFNGGDEQVKEGVRKRLIKRKVEYGGLADGIRAEVRRTGIEGTKGVLWLGKEKMAFETKLFGRQNLANLAGAVAIVRALGVRVGDLREGVMRLVPLPHRFELVRERYGVLVIDNAYSSNETGFVEALNFLATQSSYTRILVTPGLVELGKESELVHRRLAKLVNARVDRVILVGKSERVRVMEEELTAVKVTRVGKTLDFVKVVKGWKLPKPPLVLLENDVTENYS